MATGLANELNKLMDTLSSVPYEWGRVAIGGKTVPSTKPAKSKLFQEIGVYNGQDALVGEGKIDGFQIPAAFIEIESSEIVPFLSRNLTMRDLILCIHIMDEMYVNGAKKDMNLQVFGYRDIANPYLSEHKLDTGGRLIAMKEEQDYSHDNLYHYKMYYKVAWIDNTASPYVANNPFVSGHNPATSDGWELDITSEKQS